MCRTTKAVFEKTDVTPAQVTGISFCSQMQGMVLVDEYGRALRRPMSYMDQRASAEFKACQTHGPCVSGVNIGMLLRSLRATHAASTSVKDPLWKYKWVQAHEPEIFQEAHKWLDVKESLIARATGEFVMTRDSAYSTFLYDTRPGHEGWNEGLCRMYGVETRHLAKIIECTDVAGLLTEQAARLSTKSDLGMAVGYALDHWQGLVLFAEDGRVEMDSNLIENQIRPVTLGRKNALFAGHDEGGRSWARFASVIGTCKLNGVEPYAWLKAILQALAAGHPTSAIDELLPWNFGKTAIKAAA